MSGENETHPRPEEEADRRSCSLQKFKLYETKMNFYMVGTDKRRTMWRVLKIDRSEPTELNILEDCTKYSENECRDLLQRIHEGNRSIGGLKLVTNCYGIVGFIKFLGPYYMLIITRRKKIGAICGHTIYAVTKSEIIALPNNSWQSNMGFSKNENRYKKLLCTVDLTKDFFFSYTYHVMRSLQKNLCNDQTGHVLYETMFVWNEFLTRGIRIHLKNTLWTVALVYGFFKQEKLSISGKEFKLTLIARRSRYYAGTRYLKRGVNEKGRVANDVETEQIVFEDVPKGFPTQISSVVQNRGSIPLFWSQETSRLNIKPDIILHKREQNFEATRLHFQNLVNRYGNPIIILNLIKTREKRPRESILRAEFANAIDIINKDLSDDNRLRFLHWDLHKHARRNATNVLALLGKVTSYALNITGFLYFQVAPSERLEGALKCPLFLKNESLEKNINETLSGTESQEADIVVDKKFVVKPAMFQKGILRTNCIDCLDRTNVAQYAYGLAALGSQLHALGFTDVANIDLDDPLADDLMKFYETMGDTLALQYGGSAAHNKIFSERRGQWKAATQSQEFLRTLQRYYSNAYVDAEKQDAINVFLGYFQPQQGKPELWELKSDQHYNKRTPAMVDENARLSFKRSLSDGNILCESNTPVTNPNVGQKKYPNSALPATTHQGGMGTSEMLSCENDISLTRFNPSMPRRQLFPDRGSENGEIYFSEYMAGDGLNCTNFVDVDWLSSSANSCEEEGYDGSMHVDSPIATMSSENVVNGISVETIPFPSEIEFVLKEKEQTEIKPDYDYNKNSKDLGEFSDRFIWWVTNGETLCH